MATVGSAPVIWSFRVGTPVVAIAVAVWLFRVCRRPELLPDLLRRVASKYFEKDGLCFMPVIEVSPPGQALLSLYFQNRNSGHAQTVVAIQPLNRMFASRKPRGVATAIECPGGAFGVCRIPLPIPARSQGKRMAFAVGATTKYPAGRGTLLRRRTGVRVTAIRELGTGHQLARTLLLLPFGLLSTSAPAHVTLTLPKGVRETADDAPAPTFKILWKPDLPTGGFPVAPIRKAA
jgi:hypothetical protein